MKPETNTKAKTANAKTVSRKKLNLKGTTKSAAAISPRLAANHNETLLIR
jgi:hypothetical protein